MTFEGSNDAQRDKYRGEETGSFEVKVVCIRDSVPFVIVIDVVAKEASTMGAVVH